MQGKCAVYIRKIRLLSEEKRLLYLKKQCSKSLSYGIFEQLPAECLCVVHRLLVNDNDRIEKKILFPGKKFAVHLRKFVHVFVGGGYELHVIHQSVALQFFRKAVDYPFDRIFVGPEKFVPSSPFQVIHFRRELGSREKAV